MRKNIAFALFIALNFNSYSQLDVKKVNGGSVITKLGMGIKVNEGSTLSREFITINSPSCPLQLTDVGINTAYANSYSFVPVGNITPRESITAYEVHHVLYDVFGRHIKTLSNQTIKDINAPTIFDKYSSWYASENNVSEYFICVSYVADVRTANNVIWHYDSKEMQSELNKIKLKFDESFEPPKIKDKDK
jgi:hypothetical protein